MKTSTFERAMVQNANTTPLRHEQLGGAHCPQCGRLGHACTTHSNMGSTMHTVGGTGIGLGLIALAVMMGYNSNRPSPRRNKFIKTVGLTTAAFAVGGYAQQY